jgi:hypothetical protein
LKKSFSWSQYLAEGTGGLAGTAGLDELSILKVRKREKQNNFKFVFYNCLLHCHTLLNFEMSHDKNVSVSTFFK